MGEWLRCVFQVGSVAKPFVLVLLLSSRVLEFVLIGGCMSLLLG